MDELREKIIYKNTPIEICLRTMTSIDQYELMRLLASFPEKQVKLCTHTNTTKYMDDILKHLKNIMFFKCLPESPHCSSSSS